MIVPIISLDTETTGLEPAVHAPWEIAWCTATHDVENSALVLHRRRSHLISLDPNARLTPKALDIGGFMKRYAAVEAMGRRLAWWAVQTMLFDDLAHIRQLTMMMNPEDTKVPDVHLVGAVPQFDHRMLERWLGWNHWHWHYHLIDVETLCAGRFGYAPPLNTRQMTTDLLGENWANPWGAQHEALADTRWNLELYAKAFGLTIIDTAHDPGVVA